MSESTSIQPRPGFGILPSTPKPTVHTVGISLQGAFYLYGDSPAAPGPTVPAIGTPRILEIAVAQRGANSRYGARAYLDVRMVGACPGEQFLLTLPCHNKQWSYRSLLGALLTLDLPNTPLKLQPNPGREAVFIQVYLDPEGEQQVIAPAIGPERADLEAAVDRCRINLGLAPQFAIPVTNDA